jgi:hypothetical protein
VGVPIPFREAEVEALSHADNAYRVHHLLDFAQVTPQQLPTKNHASDLD